MDDAANLRLLGRDWALWLPLKWKRFLQILAHCRSLVGYFKHSNVQQKLPDGLKLKQDVETRWCSKCDMLKRLRKALPFLRPILQQTSCVPDTAWESLNFIENKIEIIDSVIIFLEPFAETIREMQSASDSTLEKVQQNLLLWVCSYYFIYPSLGLAVMGVAQGTLRRERWWLSFTESFEEHGERSFPPERRRKGYFWLA